MAKTKKTVDEMATNETTIVVKPIEKHTMKITIAGDSDLILNKMCRSTTEGLIDERNDKSKTIKEKNKWDDIITSMHWRDPLPEGVYTEKTLKELLKKNAPCISAFGLKKSFGDAVVRNEISKYATKFNASCNVLARGNLIPIQFTEHYIDEMLMKTRTGSQVLARHNHFVGWKATFTIQYMGGGAYSAEQIVNIINLAGFGLGIGSGRSSGYGRYHVEGVE